MTNTTEKKKLSLDRLETETVQKIDFIIRGLELGKFDDTAKKVEFLGKLAGDESPQYIAKLLDRISKLEYTNINQGTEISNLTIKLSQLETDKITLETRINTLENSMQTVAKAIRQLFEPAPLKSNYQMTEIEAFCNNNGATSY